MKNALKMKYHFIILVFCFWAESLYSQCDFKVERVVIYKDGTAFIEEKGECNVEENVIKLKAIKEKPSSQTNYSSKKNAANPVVLGTFQVESTNAIIQSIYTGSEDTEGEYVSTYELVNRNLGKSVNITQTNKKSIAGTIVYIESISNSRDTRIRQMVLRKDGQLHYINMEDIVSLEVVDENPKVSSSRYIYAKLAEPQTEPAEIKLSYLQKGISWMPNYRITLLDSSHLVLDFDITVLNDLIEMDNSQLDLVIGVPAFEYSTVGDPLLTKYRVIDFLNKLGEKPKGNGNPSIRRVDPRSQSFRRYTVENYGNNSLPKFDGGAISDAYVYRVNGVTLGAKERLTRRLITTAFDYQSYYSVELASNEVLTKSSSSRKVAEKDNYVWQTISFTNNSGLPLTTAPVFFVNQEEERDMPISQSSISYTPENTTGQIKMLVTPNIFVIDKDKEVSREKIGYRTLVKMSGSIEVTNLFSKTVPVKINREILGKMLTSDVDWQITGGISTLSHLNPRNVISWNTEVGANEKIEITYEYEIWIN